MKTNIFFGFKAWVLALIMSFMGFVVMADEVDTTKCITFVPDSTQEIQFMLNSRDMNVMAKIEFGTDSVIEVEAFYASDWYSVGAGQVIKVYGAFTEFGISDCKLRSLDVSGNDALMNLGCINVGLTSLDVSQNVNLQTLECFDNALTSLDVSNCVNMEMLNVNNNRLTSLDVSHCRRLMSLECMGNELTNIEFGDEQMLIDGLFCADNRLTSLDVSNIVSLRGLMCRNNQLEHLDVSHNEFLGMLDCSNNNLSMLNLSANNNLSRLVCYDADFTTEVWNKIICDLPDVTEIEWGASIEFDSIDMMTEFLAADGENATLKGWKILRYTEQGPIDYSDSTTGNYECGDPAGIEEVADGMDVKIYPNPSCGVAKVMVGNLNGMVKVSVVDMSGRVLVERSLDGNEELMIDRLTCGTYLVRVVSDEQIVTKKLVVR